MSARHGLPALFVLSAAHGLNDFAAGAMLAGLAASESAGSISLWFTVYVALAFAGQVPLAVLIDKRPHWKGWMIGATLLMCAAIGVAAFSLHAAIVLSGLASAVVHVAGGGWALRLQVPQGFGAGLFAAPGIVGLTLGGFSGLHGLPGWLTLLPLVLLALLVPLRPLLRVSAVATTAPREKLFDAHDLLMLLLLLVITLRSAVWDIFQAINAGDERLLLGLALAAAAGKICGGLLADRMNALHLLSGSLLAALGLLHLGNRHEGFLFAGIALLQATLPPAVLLVSRLLPELPAMTNALVLGLAVTLGGFPYLLNAAETLVPVGLTLAALVLALLRMGRKKGLGA